MSAEDRLQTLLHETAHAICFARWDVAEGHSPRFWSLARKLGVARKVAPETEHLRRVREANARYAYRCPGCTAEWTRRTPFGRARLCASCERAGRPARLILVRRPKPARRRAAYMKRAFAILLAAFTAGSALAAGRPSLERLLPERPDGHRLPEEDVRQGRESVEDAVGVAGSRRSARRPSFRRSSDGRCAHVRGRLDDIREEGLGRAALRR